MSKKHKIRKMKNSILGNPLDLIQNYINQKKYRSLSKMTNEEARLILDFAVDNGEWKGVAVNSINISSRSDNFIEGDVSFGEGITYHFEIRYDCTVQIYQLEYDEEKISFIPKGGIRKTYRFADITFLMMSQGFCVHQHLI